MYGVEAQSSGGGGLAAQAPSDLYFGQALGITNNPVQVGAAPYSGNTLPSGNIGDQVPSGLMASSSGAVSNSGQAVRVPVSQQVSSWSSVLDFHNSVAPWILLGILILYGWIHLSVRANAGHRASAAVVL